MFICLYLYKGILFKELKAITSTKKDNGLAYNSILYMIKHKHV